MNSVRDDKGGGSSSLQIVGTSYKYRPLKENGEGAEGAYFFSQKGAASCMSLVMVGCCSMGREICKFKTGSLLDVQADSARADIHADSPSNDSIAL